MVWMKALLIAMLAVIGFSGIVAGQPLDYYPDIPPGSWAGTFYGQDNPARWMYYDGMYYAYDYNDGWPWAPITQYPAATNAMRGIGLRPMPPGYYQFGIMSPGSYQAAMSYRNPY